jgi:hypothetical protein
MDNPTTCLGAVITRQLHISKQRLQVVIAYYSSDEGSGVKMRSHSKARDQRVLAPYGHVK